MFRLDGERLRPSAPPNHGYDVLRRMFFTSLPAGQAAGEAFIRRLSQR
jgi:hypothetical protein